MLCNLEIIGSIREFSDDPEFQKRWRESKQENKRKLARYVEKNLGVVLPCTAIFDAQIKRIHEYKRQLLNIL